MNFEAESGSAEEWIDAVVSAKRIVADGIAHFVLTSPTGAALPAFKAGAHIDVELPGGLVRQYSLCNDPLANDRYELGVLLEPEGRGGSRAAHEVLEQGDRVQIGRPRNLFGLVPARHAILLGGGIGITPVLAMARQLHREDRSFELHYCARSRTRMAFREDIAAEPIGGHTRFYVDDGTADQRFDADNVLPIPDPEVHAYVCGPRGFIDYVMSTLRAKGWQEDNIHAESFTADTAPADVDIFEIQVGIDGPVISVHGDQTVAQALIEAGYGIPLSCEQGICGTCAMPVLAGEPDHRDMYFTEKEHAANDRFTPCCSRSLSARLVVDVGR